MARLDSRRTLPPGEIVEEQFYFVIQRTYHLADDQVGWTDSSFKYWGIEGNDTARREAVVECERLRQLFGQDQVRVVRRDSVTTESPVE